MKRLLLVLAACAAPEPVGEATSAIVGGTESDASQNATVLVMHYDALAKGGGAASGCTGTLLAPRLVLTARHCVAETDPSAACGADGKTIEGGAVLHDYAASAVYVFGGRARPDFLSGTARPAKGAELVTNGASTICNGDIALVLLDRDLEGAELAPVRLDAPAVKAEKVTVVGWGISEDDANPPVRRQRTGVEILDVGPWPGVGPREFRTSEGTCKGDSGGPAVAASGAVIGVLSRGGGAGASGAEGCLESTSVFTATNAYADLIRSAYEKVGQAPWAEGEPDPRTLPPSSKPADDSSCSASGRSPSGGGWLLAGAFVLLLRRRKSGHQPSTPF